MIKTLIKNVLLEMILFYRLMISPFVASNSCRFYPSCSGYAKDAITKRGLVIGLILSVYRIAKCNPLCSGGYDPVLDPKEKV